VNKMIKLKNILSEGFAWERKEGKGLPTLAEVQAEYEANEAANDSIEEVEESRTSTISAKRATAELKQKLAGKRSDGMGAYTAVIYGIDETGKKVKLTSLSDIAKFKTFSIGDEDEPRWQDDDGDGNWYEPGDDVKENVNESFVNRLKKNFIGGATRK
jgi:hypothetical protein